MCGERVYQLLPAEPARAEHRGREAAPAGVFQPDHAEHLQPGAARVDVEAEPNERQRGLHPGAELAAPPEPEPGRQEGADD